MTATEKTATTVDWHQATRVGFDLETTGRDATTARVVTASLVELDGAGTIVKELEWLVDPGMEIPEEAANVHGVSTEKARAEGMDSAEAVAEINAHLAAYVEAGIPIIAYNAPYDFTVMHSESLRHGLTPVVPTAVIDPYVLDKQLDRYRKGKRNLLAACSVYGVVLENAHTSAADALAAVLVADSLAEKFEKIRIDLKELHSKQIAWKAEQSASLQEWFRKKDPEAVVNAGWPILL